VRRARRRNNFPRGIGASTEIARKVARGERVSRLRSASRRVAASSVRFAARSDQPPEIAPEELNRVSERGVVSGDVMKHHAILFGPAYP